MKELKLFYYNYQRIYKSSGAKRKKITSKIQRWSSMASWKGLCKKIVSKITDSQFNPVNHTRHICLWLTHILFKINDCIRENESENESFAIGSIYSLHHDLDFVDDQRELLEHYYKGFTVHVEQTVRNNQSVQFNSNKIFQKL